MSEERTDVDTQWRADREEMINAAIVLRFSARLLIRWPFCNPGKAIMICDAVEQIIQQIAICFVVDRAAEMAVEMMMPGLSAARAGSVDIEKHGAAVRAIARPGEIVLTQEQYDELVKPYAGVTGGFIPTHHVRPGEE